MENCGKLTSILRILGKRPKRPKFRSIRNFGYNRNCRNRPKFRENVCFRNFRNNAKFRETFDRNWPKRFAKFRWFRNFGGNPRDILTTILRVCLQIFLAFFLYPYFCCQTYSWCLRSSDPVFIFSGSRSSETDTKIKYEYKKRRAKKIWKFTGNFHISEPVM